MQIRGDQKYLAMGVYYDYTNKVGADYWISDSYCSDSEAENQKIILNPKDIMTIEIYHAWDDVRNQPKLPTNGITFDYDITLGFEQAIR